MAFSKISLTFTRRVEVGESITFKWRDVDINGGADPITTMETCAVVRSAVGQFTYKHEVLPIASILSYLDAWGIDYNATSKFDITHGVDVMEITAKKSNIEFLDFTSNAGVSAVITNEPIIPTFRLDDYSFADKGSDQCTEVNVIVDTTTPILNVTSPLSILGVNNTQVTFAWVRGASFTFSAIDSYGSTIDVPIVTPEHLNEPVVDIINTPSGATANIEQQPTLDGLTYSLDDITYQSSSVFSGLLPDNYTVYVKDTYGCKKSTAFTVDEFSPVIDITDPVAFLSNTNSLRFKTNEIWDNVSIYKNDENTLSNEEKALLVYPYIHKYQNSDVITTQLKSNFDTLTGKIIDCDGNETALTFIQKTSNLNKKDRRDAIAFEFEDGRYGYYFQTGNIYDYDDGVLNTITGTYELFGEIPVWAKIGQYFSVNDGAYYQIKDIVYVESIQADVLVIDTSFAGSPINVKVSAIYNIFNWDAYEFDVDLAAFPNTEIQVEITFSDSDFDTVVKTSEKIQTYELLDDLMTIEAFNSFNNEIVYQTGIKHLLRLQYDEFGSDSESELEIEKTDQYVYSLDGKSYIKKKLVFNYLSTKMEQKVRQILTLNDVKLNGVGHTVESIETPERLGVTNMYKLSCTVYEVGEKPQGTVVDTNVDLDILDVPALISGDDEFIEQ